MFIAIDGIDGAGKTTLAEVLKQILAALDPIVEKEPTTQSRWGRALKESAGSGRLPRDKEIDYFHRDRIHHLESVIKPALASGKIVILDRYVDSTLAYQSESPQHAEDLYQQFLPEILVPDITFILDCPPEVGLARIAKSRNGNSKFEKLQTLKSAQLIYEARKGPTYVHIDATKQKQETLAQVLEVLSARFEKIKATLVSQGYSTNPGHVVSWNAQQTA